MLGVYDNKKISIFLLAQKPQNIEGNHPIEGKINIDVG
jgi:hypothetical protein